MGSSRATIDFFASQHAARRRSALLVVSFGLALLLVVALVYLALLVPANLLSHAPPGSWSPGLLLGAAAGVTALTGVGSVYHLVTLSRDGGEAVARMMGGTPLDRGSAAGAERQLWNVVEEMAIASGLPVPRLFVLEREQGINALAAGLSPGRAVIAVTRGALDKLSRDELQGVVAHELSHVLNSDMKLNLRLMGLVGGLTILSLIGRVVLDGALRGGRTDREAEQPRFIAFVFGLLVSVAGWVGEMGGQLVRLAVSREREYLADAAAVQFTRNPDGLAGALRKVAREGSMLSAPAALEASHFLFANGVSGVLERWFAPHPPLEERIRRLEPGGAAEQVAAATAAPSLARTPREVVARVGALRPAPLLRASRILSELPPELVAAAREPFAARALVCGLLLAPDPAQREAELGRVALPPGALGELRRLLPALDRVGRERRVALLDLALPALDALSAPQLAALRAELHELADAHGRLTVFEWALQRAVVRRIERRLSGGRTAVRYRAVEQVEVECLEILSLLARAGARDAAAAQAALEAGAAELGVRGRWTLLPAARLGAASADRALAALDEAAPDVKQRVLRGCVACAVADARVTSDEAGVLRAISSSLGCPMPPFQAA